MTTEEPQVTATGQYHTMQACRALGITKDTLRKYRKLGLIKPSCHRGTMRIYYTGREILRFWRAAL